MTPPLYDAFFRRPNFLVLIYRDNSTTTLVIRHFKGPVCHIIEAIDVCKWWDPHEGFVLGPGSTVVNSSLD